MAYNPVPTYTTGDTFTAANANTYWRDNFAAGVPDIFTTAGDIAYATAANAATRLGIGANGKVLAVAAGIPAWITDPVKDLITTAGDLLYGTAADALARLGIGATNKALIVVGGVPAWGDIFSVPLVSTNLTPDHTADGIKAPLRNAVGTVTNFGDVVYLDSNGRAVLPDADAIATSSAMALCADASVGSNAGGTYLLMGFARDDTWNWTPGGLIYLSVTGTTGNTLTQTAPGAGDVVQILGVAFTADIIYFNPQLVQVEQVA